MFFFIFRKISFLKYPNKKFNSPVHLLGTLEYILCTLNHLLKTLIHVFLIKMICRLQFVRGYTSSSAIEIYLWSARVLLITFQIVSGLWTHSQVFFSCEDNQKKKKLAGLECVWPLGHNRYNKVMCPSQEKKTLKSNEGHQLKSVMKAKMIDSVKLA